VRVEAFREVLATQLRLVPRFRQPLYVPRPGLGRPLWVDAPAFDLADHVGVVPVPAPGDEGALLRAAEQLRRVRLDRSRPLWQMWLLPGCPTSWAGSSWQPAPIGDAIIVLRSNGPKATVYGVHGATAIVLLATAALLFTYVARLE
jgi:hypothetical protein